MKQLTRMGLYLAMGHAAELMESPIGETSFYPVKGFRMKVRIHPLREGFISVWDSVDVSFDSGKTWQWAGNRYGAVQEFAMKLGEFLELPDDTAP